MAVESNNGRVRKQPVRSRYLFPAYDFGTALQIAEAVERGGAGRLTQSTLAINLGVSAKSSGFLLRGLTARQFGLLTKAGEELSTTDLAKAIIKPTSPEEKSDALRESFLRIPLFREVAMRFKGQHLPQDAEMRNVLEREFEIESNRVGSALRVLMDSARDIGVLVSSGGHTYLSVERTTIMPVFEAPSEPDYVLPNDPPKPQQTQRATTGASTDISAPSGSLVISEQDLAEFEDKEFDEVWAALGKVFRARGRRQLEQQRANERQVESNGHIVNTTETPG